MQLPHDVDWLQLAGRLNQLSLLPFLAFLWTLWHIPAAPKKAVRGWTFYLAFIAVAIPAGIYCKTQLGTSMANVDWIHGGCEALLTLANLFIVLGLRDALREKGRPEAVARGQMPGDAVSTSASQADRVSRCQSDTNRDTRSTVGQQTSAQRFVQEERATALADMQYMQQLHAMSSAVHGGADVAAAAGLITHQAAGVGDEAPTGSSQVFPGAGSSMPVALEVPHHLRHHVGLAGRATGTTSLVPRCAGLHRPCGPKIGVKNVVHRVSTATRSCRRIGCQPGGFSALVAS